MGVCNGKVKNNRIKAGVSEQISRYNVLNYCKIYTVTYQELKFLS